MMNLRGNGMSPQTARSHAALLQGGSLLFLLQKVMTGRPALAAGFPSWGSQSNCTGCIETQSYWPEKIDYEHPSL
jgi:hypothetical protein